MHCVRDTDVVADSVRAQEEPRPEPRIRFLAAVAQACSRRHSDVVRRAHRVPAAQPIELTRIVPAVLLVA